MKNKKRKLCSTDNYLNTSGGNKQGIIRTGCGPLSYFQTSYDTFWYLFRYLSYKTIQENNTILPGISCMIIHTGSFFIIVMLHVNT